MGHPEPVQLNQQEKWICNVLGLAEWELGVFLRSWTPNRQGGGDTSIDAIGRPNTLEEFRLALRRTGRNDKRSKG